MNEESTRHTDQMPVNRGSHQSGWKWTWRVGGCLAIGRKENMQWTQGIPIAYLRRDSRGVRVKMKTKVIDSAARQRSVNQAFRQSSARLWWGA